MTAEFAAADPILARFLLHADAGMRRISFEVSGEQVSLFVRQGKLRAQCTCGVESCEHQKLAASFLGADGSVASALPGEVHVRSSMRPPPPVLPGDLGALAAALDELSLAMARTGLDAPDSPSIREALEQVSARAPRPTSLTLSRWIGRLGEALQVGEVGKIARLLDGAQHCVAEMRAEKPAPQAMARVRSWLGRFDGEPLETLADSALVEVGREWLTGTSRASLERRYLVDLHGGEAFCEERRRGELEISVGPCPRVVQVGFAELDSAVQPRRLRLLQYTVSPEPSQEQWLRLSEFARKSVADLAAFYASTAHKSPGTAEPFVLFSPAKGQLGAEQVLVRDGVNAGIELADDADVPLVDTLRAMSEGAEVAWIAGRLTGLNRGLVLRPISLLLKRAGRFTLRRVT